MPERTWNVSSSSRWMWKGGQRLMLGVSGSDAGAGGSLL